MGKNLINLSLLICFLLAGPPGWTSQCGTALALVLARWKSSQTRLDLAFAAKRGDPYRQEKITRALEEVSKAPDQVMKVIRRAVELMNEGHEDVNSFLIFLKSRPTLSKNQLPPQIGSLSKNLKEKFGIFPHTNPDSFWFVEKEGESSFEVRSISFADLEAFKEP